MTAAGYAAYKAVARDGIAVSRHMSTSTWMTWVANGAVVVVALPVLAAGWTRLQGKLEARSRHYGRHAKRGRDRKR